MSHSKEYLLTKINGIGKKTAGKSRGVREINQGYPEIESRKSAGREEGISKKKRNEM